MTVASPHTQGLSGWISKREYQQHVSCVSPHFKVQKFTWLQDIPAAYSGSHLQRFSDPCLPQKQCKVWKVSRCVCSISLHLLNIEHYTRLREDRLGAGVGTNIIWTCQELGSYSTMYVLNGLRCRDLVQSLICFSDLPIFGRCGFECPPFTWLLIRRVHFSVLFV